MTTFDRSLPIRRRADAAPLRERLRCWASLHRQRRDLARLDDAALRDIGVSRRAAKREGARPFWDRPRS